MTILILAVFVAIVLYHALILLVPAREEAAA
jgi:hypothetical protein